MPMRLSSRPVPKTLRGVAGAVFLALAIGAAAQGAVPVPASSRPPQLDPPDERIVAEKVEGTLKDKKASIQVYSISKSARIWIDRKEIDWVPYLGDIDEGSHYIEVRIPGYYPLGHWFLLSEKTLYTLRFSPRRITGTLSLQVEPADASVLVDGAAAAPGRLELPAGKHRVDVRRFGYRDWSKDLDLGADEAEELAVSLEEASFGIGGLRFTRESFNPQSVGASSKVGLEFRVTAPGSAKVEILDADGADVASLEFPDMRDWYQRAEWNGLGRDGKGLPEGLYVAHLVATSADGGGSVEAEAKVWIDSSLVARVLGPDSASPGLLYSPDPSPPPSGTSAIEGFYFAPLGSSSSRAASDGAFGIAGAVAAARNVELGFHASVELDSESFGSGDLDGSALLAFLGDKTSAWSGAFFFRGGYSSLDLPAAPGTGSQVEASVPLGARLGSVAGADARLALAPGFRVDFSGSPTCLATGRLGLWLEGKSFRAGVSGELPLSFDDGVRVYRRAGSALEGRILLGSFVAAAYATVDFLPGEAPAPGLGMGLGLLF